MSIPEARGIGILLRRYRLRAGLSQEALAEQAQMTAAGIAALERGRRTVPRSDTVARLARALSLSPGERATLLVDTARLHPVPAAVAPDTPTLQQARAATLPMALTALLGREQEAAAVQHLLGSGTTRLLTLTGPGGVGKTRLALAVATSVRAEYGDGVAFVDLSAVREPGLVASTIVQALGLREGGDQRADALLHTYLMTRHLLLVLDNFEQVLEAAPLVSDLLAACPYVTVLVTSRMVLRVRAEQRFTVPPLATPVLHRGPPRQEVVTYAAVRLFVERARMVQPNFALTAEDAELVGEICRRLDGIPLAIELVAARVGVLPLSALRERLERRWDLLRGGSRDLPDRQKTLRTAIDWSYQLLEPNEQQLFTRLGVFGGSCTLEAITAICDPPGVLDVLEVVGSLVDKSLLVPTEGRENPRFRLLETLREYAREQLETRGEMGQLQSKHAAYYLAMVEEAEPQMSGPQQHVWLERCEYEHDNLRTVLRWALQNSMIGIGLRVARALLAFWEIRGHLSEGRAWLEQLLAAGTIPNDGTPEVWIMALTGAGWLAHTQGDYDRAATLFEQSATQRRASGQLDTMTDALVNAALQARAHGDNRRARVLLEQSLAVQRAMNNRQSIAHRGLGLSLFKLGLVTREQGDYVRAATLNEECLTLHRVLGDREGMAISLLALGDIARDLGKAEQVYRYCEESLALFQELRGTWGIGFSLNNLALAAALDGDLDRALTLAADSVSVFDSLGAAPSRAEARRTLGRLMAAQGDGEQAQALLVESLTLARVAGPRWLVAANLEELAVLAGIQGRSRHAVRLWAAAEVLRAAIGVPLPPLDQARRERAISAMRADLGVSEFTATWALGEALPLDESVTEVLDAAEGSVGTA